jgi:Cupin domain.
MSISVLLLRVMALVGVLLCAVAGITYWPGVARATPAKDFTSLVLSISNFEEFDLKTHVGAHKVDISTKGRSDVHMLRNVIAPGGHTGWHTHPGPSIVSVKSGTATLYDGDDPNCTPATFPAGTGFVDKGGEHVHILRNEGSEDLEVFVFSIVPFEAARRVDAPAPGNCPF